MGPGIGLFFYQIVVLRNKYFAVNVGNEKMYVLFFFFFIAFRNLLGSGQRKVQVC